MKVLFSYFPLFVSWNHGAALLTAICREAGIDASMSPLWLGWFEQMLASDVIAFSFVTDADYHASIPFIRAARAARKHIIAGGVYARRGGMVDGTLVDLVCRGEAEKGIVAYLRDGDMTIFNQPQYTKSIDGLPKPDLSGLTGYEFHRNMPFLLGKRIYPFQTSRGCWYGGCSFCETQFQPPGIRMSHEIHDDITGIVDQYHPDLLYLLDALPPYHLIEWQEQWEGIRVPFQSYIRADIRPEYLEFMIDHGLTVTAFGVESGDEEFRNNGLGKHLMDDDIRRTVWMLRKHNVIYMPFFMEGCPGETDVTRAATADMARELGGWPIVWEYSDLKSSIIEV